MGSVVTFDVCLKTQRMKSSTPAGDDIRVNSCPAVCSERSADRTKERHLVVGSFEVLQKPGATCVQTTKEASECRQIRGSNFHRDSLAVRDPRA